MDVSANIPVMLRGPSAVAWYFRFMRDPLQAMLRSHATHGPFLQLPHLRSLTRRPRTFVVAVGAAFNQEVLDNAATWRTVSIMPKGPRNSAARRLGMGIIRMNGRSHGHYRRLLVPPLHRKSLAAIGADMVRLVDDEVGSWPQGEVIDLWEHVQRLMRILAIGLLLGGDRVRGYPIAELISEFLDFNWSWKVAACPIDIPGTPYHRMLRSGETLERRIIEWAACKRGQLDERDLLSIVVNRPDEHGHPASDDKIVGHAPTLFAAAYETCQNALLWTLVLLTQHPQVARDLLDELQDNRAGSPLPFEKLVQLSLLDAIVKESMRILPPVPQQFRVAERDTTLAGHAIPATTRVMLSALLTNRDPALYPDPARFKPERWANINPSPYEYLVFSAGSRGCPGYWFGSCAIKAAIAAIFARYRLTLVAGARLDTKVHVALSPRWRVGAILHRQDGAFRAAPIGGAIRNLVQFPT
jgi:cytochrome P450